LQRVDWPSRYLKEKEAKNKSQDAPQVTSPPQTRADVSKFAGTYTNPGYGTVTLCAWPTSDAHCAEVLLEYMAVDPAFLNARQTTLFASFPKIWFNHLRITQKNDEFVTLFADTLFPHGHGNDKSPFIVTSEGGEENPYGEFVLVDGEPVGLALWGLQGQDTPIRRVPGKIKESAEVWFDRVI